MLVYEISLCCGCGIAAHISCIVDLHSKLAEVIFYEVEIQQHNPLFPSLPPQSKLIRFFKCAICNQASKGLKI